MGDRSRSPGYHPMNRRLTTLAFVVGFVVFNGCKHNEQKPLAVVETTLEEFQTIEQEHAASRQEWLRVQSELASGEARTISSREFRSYWLRAINEMLAVAESQPLSPVGKLAAIWVVNSCDTDYGPHQRATNLLRVHHDQAEEMALCKHLVGFSPAYEQILRAVGASNPSREARGNAHFQLAELLDLRSDFRARMDATPEFADERERNMGKEIVAHLASIDRSRDRDEAVELLRRVQNQFADVPFRNTSLGILATELLMQLQQTYPELGKVAWEIKGRGLNDNTLALSEYRGKVVVVTFWTSWCGACLDRIPEENRLTEDLKGAPFALLGVNGDEAIEDAQRAVTQKGVKFQSWWDDPDLKPTIVSRWGVKHWPTTFVLDKSGVIRYKDLAGPDLRSAVTKLLDETSEGSVAP